MSLTFLPRFAFFPSARLGPDEGTEIVVDCSAIVFTTTLC